MRLVHALTVSLLLACSTAFADEHVAIYVESGGRIIELFENCVDELFLVPTGSMMAMESAVITCDGDPDDCIVRVWERDGDEWIVIHFLERDITKRFHRSEVKMQIIDRPWVVEPEVPSELAPA